MGFEILPPKDEGVDCYIEKYIGMDEFEELEKENADLRERLARLVEAAENVYSLLICLLGDGMTEETQPIEVANLSKEIAAAKEVKCAPTK